MVEMISGENVPLGRTSQDELEFSQELVASGKDALIAAVARGDDEYALMLRAYPDHFWGELIQAFRLLRASTASVQKEVEKLLVILAGINGSCDDAIMSILPQHSKFREYGRQDLSMLAVNVAGIICGATKH
ncbi:hypothetical protein LGM58_43190 [Burkholderia contaminans]|uniref:hypothetical protein n=1 Tax=Burkholderia contaminans TaxID=488447 RepID=UPI001CF2D068|nr:hypothetical protein [Burkholderia contaminans]MCA7889982.1 hypothetical protein [Burkholderia contaminans]